MSITADSLERWFPIVLSLITLAGVIYSIRSVRGKNKAETYERVASANSMTIDDLAEQIARLNLRAASELLKLTDSRRSVRAGLELIARMLQGTNILLGQVRAAGLCPDWLPDPEIERLVRLCVTEGDRLDVNAILPLTSKANHTS